MRLDDTQSVPPVHGSFVNPEEEDDACTTSRRNSTTAAADDGNVAGAATVVDAATVEDDDEEEDEAPPLARGINSLSHSGSRDLGSSRRVMEGGEPGPKWEANMQLDLSEFDANSVQYLAEVGICFVSFCIFVVCACACCSSGVEAINYADEGYERLVQHEE